MPYKQGREAPHFSMDLSRVSGKKVGGFYKKWNLKALILLGRRFREIIILYWEVLYVSAKTRKYF